METKTLTINDVIKAIFFSQEAHIGQIDKNNEPYIYHPMRVWFAIRDQFWDEKTQIAALLHDVLEDTGITKDILSSHFNDEIVDAVEVLTRKENEVYGTYIKRVKQHLIARVVKVADLMDNLDEKRLGQLSEYEQKKLSKRYRNAARFLLAKDEDVDKLELDF
jgi:guanosine-3',5'-bis(diphosphate) 3'-pyrophosphohydrolase